ncbi:DUF3578 domain-containing protein [Methylobacterium oxalidis]|uniref:Type IV methyl-directed restriction enzyme EcoKMcrB subunit DNA-binding domain-containing protein n=1 Tax=Methylobacterium oxalidis TaxID=944322 RepID=A0A512J4Z1_9HYPH|nr:DUF3578 domain-containing protein [Methylobacterium oxalidis]GEP05057.1 hypothetical protein MOX02_30950 [Methylobacterium oxalidis]GJE33345.1 hypothetical protein LDDCCGHA_3545 [Methylobacterium oxalidis]GLS65664.1 hypothetical protein GCM10007888_40460 [Methylobacterium oxalidis]
MSLGHALRRIAEEYPLARLEPPANHPLGWVIRRGAPDELRRLLGPQAGLLVKGSAGRGSRWAAVPWIAVFDPGVTTSATRGYYLVYLFPADREAVHLSLAQGTVAAIREHGPGAQASLRASGHGLRAALSDFAERLPERAIRLGTEGDLPGGYEAAHILGLTYGLDDLGDERRLTEDLAAGLSAYRALRARGGLAAVPG